MSACKLQGRFEIKGTAMDPASRERIAIRSSWRATRELAQVCANYLEQQVLYKAELLIVEHKGVL
jgi:hypothetical protein